MIPKPVTLGIITDVHFGVPSSMPRRRCEIGDELLTRAVQKLNEEVRPDVTLVLGDLIDDGEHPDAKKRLSKLRAILDTLHSPYLAIPGNHDGDPDAFYEVLDRPADIEDIGGLRIMPFVDPGAPGYNATRKEADLQRPLKARANYAGPLVAFQHVCLGPPALSKTHYNYTNAEKLIEIMKDAKVTLSVSGHDHKGDEDRKEGGVTFVNTVGMCETPFPLTVITLEGNEVRTEHLSLAMPGD